MTASGFYVPGEGFLYRLDPRTRLWLALLGVLFAVLVTGLPWLAGLLVLVQMLLLSGGIPPKQIWGVWRAVLPLVVVILLLQPLLAPGDGAALLRLGPVRITETGLLTGLRYGLRVAAAAFAALIPIVTTPIDDLIRAFEKIGLPYAWALTIGVALRYLGTIGDLYRTISEAQHARGWDPSAGGLVRRARAAVPTLIALIVASLRLSDSLALGLAARGFGLRAGDGRRKRTHLRDLTLRPADWLVMSASAAAFALAVWLAH